MRLLTLTAAVVSVAAAAPSAQAFSLSSISSLLSNYGLNVTLPDREINLPPRVQAVASKVLDRAESTLDRLFGEGGPLAGVDFPPINLSHVNIPEIVLPGFPEVEIPDFDHPDLEEILDNARDRIAEKKAEVKAKIEAKLDKVVDRLESVIDRIESKYPNSDLPGRLEDLIDRAHGVLDDILDCDTPDEETTLLSQASLLSLPPIVAQSLQSAASSVSFSSLPVSSASVTIPEPTSALLGAAGVLLAGVARRRR